MSLSAPLRQSAATAGSAPGNDVLKGVSARLPTAVRGLGRQLGSTHRSAGTPLFLQAKLAVSQPDDVHEQQADRLADHVMQMPEPAVQRSCAACASGGAPCPACRDEQEELAVSRKADAGAAAEPGVARGASTLAGLGAGRALDAGAREFFEPRFGRGFSGVRIHDDSRANDMAGSLGARAFAFGSDLVFARGEFAPHTHAGRHLLAHELTHVLQQRGRVLQRACDPAAAAEYDTRASAIRSHEAYRRLASADRAVANEILRLARAKDDCLYYMEKLELLFNTPDAPAEDVASETAQESAEAVVQEERRLQDPTARSAAGREESASADTARVWTPRRGEDGVTFYVDRSNPNDIYVRLRVRLRARGRGTEEDVNATRSLEDAIEKGASTTGYTVDIEFVTQPGRDVFTVGVDPSRWATSGNWVGDAPGLAHELHHLLGLDDRYDYITAHAGNENMVIADRLYWFREQVRRTEPPNPASIMGGGSSPLDDDVCSVAGLGAICVTARERRRTIQAARHQAFVRCQRTYEILSGIVPASPFDRPGQPTRNEIEQANAWNVARRLFGETISLAQLTEIVAGMRNVLTPNLRVEIAQPGDAECGSRAGYVVGMRPPVRLCERFFADSAEQQIRTLVHEAAHLARISEAQGESYCTVYDCQTSCGGFNTADSWSHFVHCISTGRPDRAAANIQAAPPSAGP